MAEPDAAGPSPDGNAGPRPKRSRPLSIAEAARQMERQRAPLVAEIERAAKERRWIDAEFGLEDSDAKASTVKPSPPKKPAAPPPAPTIPSSRPPFELSPSEELLAALRQAFPGFKATGSWWFHVEKELKNCHHRSNPEGHSTFCDAYWRWTEEDLIRHLVTEGRIQKPRQKRGKTVCERLRKLHTEAVDFAETASERKLAARIGLKSPGGLSKSRYWRATLQPARAEVRARARLAKAGRQSNAAIPSKAQARSENWDQREAVDRLADEIDAVEILNRRLLELHKENPTFAETASENQIANQIGGLPEDCLPKSPYWRDVLKPRRDALQAQAGDSAIDGGH